MADADGEQGGAQLQPQYRGDGGETQEGRRLRHRHIQHRLRENNKYLTTGYSGF